jgi:hypothetical protein
MNLDDPTLDPELRAMILKLKKEMFSLLDSGRPQPPKKQEPAYTSPGRLAPRDNTKPATKEMPILDPVDQFDRNPEYGPCLGITRLARYQRAIALQCNPDPRVLDAIIKNPALGSHLYKG